MIKSAGYILYENLIFDQGYNPNVRPVVDTRQQTTVNVSLNVIRIIAFMPFSRYSEPLNRYFSAAKLKLYWYDEYLTWNPVMYNGLQSMNIPQSNVWKPDIKLENSVERYPSNYVMLNVILPISFLSLLNNCVFLLPASCGEKASFSVTVFLSLSVFLTIVSEQLPKASDKVSLFNLYVFIQVVLSTMITVTLVQIRLYHRDDEREVPTWLRSLVISCGQCAKMRSTLKQSDMDATISETNIIPTKATKSQHQTSENEKSGNSNHVTWRCVADWMDPVMFAGYTILNIICSVVLVLCSISA
ncbi:acetylcholine receptor subunit alpha-like [Mercenaria mercenaria]|uniref:acetylcholine receptor subunit alpha-like n=1 Tax=Mercenaria mercenaria TaxID=6596 RepID=UPI00234E8111|nr:acetylcholine receptor subunit alpha-like [Mercenaria mercenaria]